jgi:hypothetical protein
MLIQLLIFTIGLAGALLVSGGTWLIHQPSGYIVGGVLCLLWSYMAAKSVASQPQATNEKADS